LIEVCDKRAPDVGFLVNGMVLCFPYGKETFVFVHCFSAFIKQFDFFLVLIFSNRLCGSLEKLTFDIKNKIKQLYT
jgi:hypothetical protein